MQRNTEIILIIVALVVASVGTYFYFSKSSSESSSGSSWSAITVTSESLPAQLEEYSAVQRLPEEGVIALTVGTMGYTIRKGSVSTGLPENPDVSLTLPEKYFDIMGQYGWCTALSIARAKDELGIELHGSSAQLAWKYKSLATYRQCLG